MNTEVLDLTSVSDQDRITGISLKQLKTQRKYTRSGDGDIGLRAAKGSDPWELRDK